MSKIFGGSKSKQKSTNRSTSVSLARNQAFPAIMQAFLPTASAGYRAGMGGFDEALEGGFEGYKERSGFDFLKEMGIRGTMGSFGGGGVGQSGAAMKALQSFGNNLQSTFLDKYLAQQAQRASLGAQGGSIVSGAGQTSQSQSNSYGQSTGSSSSNPGMGGFIGSLLASERRLKTKIEKLGELEDGLGIYKYEYKKEPGIMYIGTMVDEVENLRPWALGPVNEEGSRTVDYSKLSGGNE